ncbi:MAG: hypothetical protein M1838_001360 [Thelocarpon superellum]|nr:MAG: hypothetical protein M1838_001360 [Thelocarpon superellum]
MARSPSPGYDPRDPPSPTPISRRAGRPFSPVNNVLPPIDGPRPRRMRPASPSSSVSSEPTRASFVGDRPLELGGGTDISLRFPDVALIPGGGPEDFTENLAYYMAALEPREKESRHATGSEESQTSKSMSYPPRPSVEDGATGLSSIDSSFSPVECSTSPRPLIRDVRMAANKGSDETRPTTQQPDMEKILSEMQRLREQLRAATEEREMAQKEAMTAKAEAKKMSETLKTMDEEGKLAARELEVARAAATEMSQQVKAMANDRDLATRELEIVKAESALLSKETQMTTNNLEDECEALKREVRDTKAAMAEMGDAAPVTARDRDQERRALRRALELSKTEVKIAKKKLQLVLVQQREHGGGQPRPPTPPTVSQEEIEAAEALKRELGAAQDEIAAVQSQLEETMEALEVSHAQVVSAAQSMKARERHWAGQLEKERKERALVEKVLMLQWGKEEMHPSQPQLYRYRNAGGRARGTSG